ncbi:hypothetical protein EC844_103107 [Acinetobacter calcoaceticus]|uniref:Type 1 fimbrial protein n=1 Tax=Acinetobacter calcoaceticus TaxID=471 RepID=A0A4R1Y0Q7_ACICA|nr:hypothetical protein EC844_103107 [Acinetobacter calcoaceticus]
MKLMSIFAFLVFISHTSIYAGTIYFSGSIVESTCSSQDPQKGCTRLSQLSAVPYYPTSSIKDLKAKLKQFKKEHFTVLFYPHKSKNTAVLLVNYD